MNRTGVWHKLLHKDVMQSYCKDVQYNSYLIYATFLAVMLIFACAPPDLFHPTGLCLWHLVAASVRNAGGRIPACSPCSYTGRSDMFWQPNTASLLETPRSRSTTIEGPNKALDSGH